MSLYTAIIVVDLWHSDGFEIKSKTRMKIKGYRQAFREALRQMDDKDTNVYGANFELEDGTFFKANSFLSE